jgi:hypothetical protein
MKQVIDDPAERKEHFDAWYQGLLLEEKVRQQSLAKRRKAEEENRTADPAIFDRLFEQLAQEVEA